MDNKLNIILNGKIVTGFEGETILQLANRYGIQIPTLCNDDRLTPFSSCFVCVVEVEGTRGLQPSCSTKIVEGMKINTDNDKVHKSRKSALELLLSNHYADCTAPCKQTCPAGVDVQGYIALINKGMYRDAVGLIKQTNPLPAICGRVCVRPCEVACRRNLLEGKGVGIDYLKRYATDMDFESGDKYMPECKPATGKKVAVIGAGPGGLSSAYYLALEGHSVEIFESSPHPGGMLRYGIPPYRLPNDIIDKEVESIEQMGVKINYNIRLGDSLSYKDLKGKYDSVILAIGSQNGTSIGCDNDKADGVYSGIDFLRNMEMTGQKYDFSGKKVAVIGGGNTAMDCCRTAMRCGASKVYIIYRRTEKEMPANPIEIHESKLEGVEYMFLTAPAKVNVNDEGKLNSLSCYKMELGEPDASGRRRPIKVEGSEFNVELDIILAAIGQKTDVNFIDDINIYSDEKLIVNKWGDIDADKKTLQTSIKSVFACGDSVTGPATLIEAIAQGRKAARSCHQFLSALPITGEKYEFISKRDNFEKQIKEDYLGKYGEQLREEMPTLDPDKRSNFYEVELGYSHEAAHEETKRCMECGCAEYYTCDLKKYSTDYEAVQNRFDGEFKKYDVDFRHPFIEIDNNKCILCSRCIRICKDVVGANALGLVNRGFESYVAPSLGESLLDTDCESCGMCISTCPTGAITENFKFKPGPLVLDSFETICNYCSVGCAVRIHHKNGFVMKVTGASGEINKDENICRFPKFGYRYLNDGKRVTKPLIKVNGKFEETSFENVFNVIKKRIQSVKPDENAFFAGARLTNEELFLIKKLSDSVKSGNTSSFHYLNRGDGYENISEANVPFSQINGSGKIYLLGSEINYENPVVGYMVNNAKTQYGVKVSVITDKEFDRTMNKADNIIKVDSYFNFIKAVNYYILSNSLENSVFINDRVKCFDEYKKNILSQNFENLVNQSGLVSDKQLVEFIEEFNNEPNAILIFAEKNVSSETAKEIFNLMLITGKLGKTSSGIISLKEKNNSQGLFDMGICNGNLQSGQLENLKNIFIFGEDPVGCAFNKDEITAKLNKSDFKVVQDYFMTDTASLADVILPASYPFEIGGSYSNAQKFILNFDAEYKSKLEKDSVTQFIELLFLFSDKKNAVQSEDISLEIASMLKDKVESNSENLYSLKMTTEDSNSKLFDYGCDYITKRFELYFEKQISESKELVN